MIAYILKRLVLMFVTLFIIISITFLLMNNLPGQYGLSNPDMDPTLRQALIAKYGLDKPLHEQYFIFMGNIILRGDLGTSTTLYPQRSVTDIIMSKLPITLQLNLMSSVLVYPLGLGIGILMALKKGTLVDTSLNVAVVFFISVPLFVMASLMQYFLAYKLGWFPILISTWKPNEWAMNWEKFRSLVLPVVALSFGSIMSIARSMRGELAETLTSDFMLLAKTKGLSHRQATLRHALRNSFLPMTGIIVSAFVGLLTGSLYIERQFSIPGLGGTLTKAIQVMDVPMTIGWMIVFTTINLLSILITDLLYGVVDPRVRIGGRRSGAGE